MEVNLRMHSMNYETSNHCQAYYSHCIVQDEAISKPFIYTTLYMIQSLEWSNATSFNHCKLHCKLLFDMFFILSLSLTEIAMQPYNLYSYLKYFMLGTLVYELYDYIFIYIKLFYNHEIEGQRRRQSLIQLRFL